MSSWKTGRIVTLYYTHVGFHICLCNHYKLNVFTRFFPVYLHRWLSRYLSSFKCAAKTLIDVVTDETTIGSSIPGRPDLRPGADSSARITDGSTNVAEVIGITRSRFGDGNRATGGRTHPTVTTINNQCSVKILF